jgi:hypothetical protein
MEPTVGEHLQEHGVLTSSLGRGDAQVGLGLGEVKDVHAIDEHREGGIAGVETSNLDLGDVGDEARETTRGTSPGVASRSRNYLRGFLDGFFAGALAGAFALPAVLPFAGAFALAVSTGEAT